MLTVAYCRVSTEEQADEGFSIEGQTDKLRLYASLRDLGEVTVITDPGLSGKYLKRPGLQQLLAAVEAGHVSHVILWRLDRLSRNLGDLILLADLFGECGVGLHSVSENLDLSSASGRMFYNVLGSFAQYFREQLSENVKMGNERAVKEGRWINRPKTGYDLNHRVLAPNEDAARVQEVFRLRGKGTSYRMIEDHTGIKYSTVCAILNSRIYLGEVLHNKKWYPAITKRSSAKKSGTPRTVDLVRACNPPGTCSRVASRVACVGGEWRSFKTAKARSLTNAVSAAKAATSPPVVRRD